MADLCDQVDGVFSVEQARQRIHQLFVRQQTPQSQPLLECLNQVLAEDVVAPMATPPWPNSAMDGYGFAHTDVFGAASPWAEQSLRVVGQALAGKPWHGQAPLQPGQAIRIMTGAMVPAGVDTVVMQEHTASGADGRQIRLTAQVAVGANIRQAGEDLVAGARALPVGQRLQAPQLALAASLGIPVLPIRPALRVAIATTGDELVELGQPLGAGQIYNSNRFMLLGLLEQWGVRVVDLGHLPDDPVVIAAKLAQAAEQVDAIVTTGGVSVGQADYLGQVLDDIGQRAFWKVAIKPGKPLLVGQVGNAAFMGLPGNPVSAWVTAQLFLAVMLRALAGQRFQPLVYSQMRSAESLRKRPGRAEFQRGTCTNVDGEWQVQGAQGQGSHQILGMAQAEVLIALPADSSGVAAGDCVPILNLVNGL